MQCPRCSSAEAVKNGRRKDRQCYKCKQCGRQFLESYHPWGYSDEMKQHCLHLYDSGMSLRQIERATHVHHTTILGWLRKAELEKALKG